MSTTSALTTPHPPVRVLLCDDQSLLRMGFRMVLDAEEDIEVVGEASDGAAAVRMARAVHPDVVLMDVRMPGTDGIAATAQIVQEQPCVRVLILTTFDLDEYAFAGLRAGASGFLLKDIPPVELTAAIRTVARGDAVVSPRVTRRMLELFAAQMPREDDDASVTHDERIGRLTAREHEVFVLMARGLSNGEIATDLVVSETTVKTHVGSILAKLEVRDRVQAVVLAFESGVVRPH